MKRPSAMKRGLWPYEAAFGHEARLSPHLAHPGACVSVCRGEHCSSAVKASDTTTPMQIRAGVDCAYSPGMVREQLRAARTANGRPYTGAGPAGW